MRIICLLYQYLGPRNNTSTIPKITEEIASNALQKKDLKGKVSKLV